MMDQSFHTRSCTQHTSDTISTPHMDTTLQISQEPTTTPKPLTADCLDALYFKCKELTRFANTFLEDY